MALSLWRLGLEEPFPYRNGGFKIQLSFLPCSKN